MQNITIQPFNIIGIAVRTTNENEQGAKDIAGLWNRFLSENLLAKIPNRVDNTVYSLYSDYEGDHTQPYTALLGCKVTNLDNLPEGMVAWEIKGGTYVHLTAKGDLTKGLIVAQWSKIVELDIRRSFEADFEVFGEKAQNPAQAEVDFFVSVKE